MEIDGWTRPLETLTSAPRDPFEIETFQAAQVLSDS